MDRLILIEVRDRRLHLRGRQRVEQFPATIGRAYDNTIILDDRYVDAHHARLLLDDDGCIVLEDLGSVNGVLEGTNGPRTARLRLPSGGTARLGETVLRVVDAGHPVAPAIPRASESRFVRSLRQPAMAWALIAATALVFMGGVWLGSFDTIRVATLVSDAIFLVAGLAIWAGIWALVGRGLGSQPRFLSHLAIASAGILASTVLTVVVSWVEFLLPGGALRAVLQFSGQVLILATVLSLHLGLVSTMLPRRRRIVALASTLALIGLTQFTSWAEHDEFDTSLSYSDALEPIGAGLVHTRSLDQFLGDVTELQATVDTLAARADRR